MVSKAVSSLNISQVRKIAEYVLTILLYLLSFDIIKWVHSTNSWLYIGPLRYAQKDRSWCTPWMKATKRQTIFAEAKKDCSLNDNCTMFFDSKGRGNYYLCGNDEKIRIKFSSTGSIRYVKEEGIVILYQLQSTY